MKAIWKFPAPLNGTVAISMPQGAEVLCVQVQNGLPCIWALVEPGNGDGRRWFEWRGTGQEFMGAPGRYVGTIQLNGGAFVWHLFESASQEGDTR